MKQKIEEDMEEDMGEVIDELEPTSQSRAGRPKKKSSQTNPEEQWGLGEVAKTTEVVFVDNETGKAYNRDACLVMILNKLNKIERGLLE